MDGEASYPGDYVLLRVEASWLEVIVGAVEASEGSWRPQPVRFGR